MFDPAEIQEFLIEEIELITLTCRAYAAKQAPQVHEDDFAETLNVLAGHITDEEELEEAA